MYRDEELMYMDARIQGSHWADLGVGLQHNTTQLKSRILDWRVFRSLQYWSSYLMRPHYEKNDKKAGLRAHICAENDKNRLQQLKIR